MKTKIRDACEQLIDSLAHLAAEDDDDVARQGADALEIFAEALVDETIHRMAAHVTQEAWRAGG